MPRRRTGSARPPAPWRSRPPADPAASIRRSAWRGSRRRRPAVRRARAGRRAPPALRSRRPGRPGRAPDRGTLIAGATMQGSGSRYHLPRQRGVEHAFQDALRVELRLCEITGRAAVTPVVAIDRVERRGGVVERGEAEHALAVRETGARTGVLHDDRLAARQVAQRPIAHPGVLELHARGLGAAEFAARALYVRAVGVGAARHV